MNVTTTAVMNPFSYASTVQFSVEKNVHVTFPEASEDVN